MSRTKTYLACLGLLLGAGCTVSPPFQHRVSDATLARAHASTHNRGPITVHWVPDDFKRRVDWLQPSSYTAGGSTAEIPTGPALVGRVHQLLDHAVGVSDSGLPVTIRVITVHTEYEYAWAGFGPPWPIDRARCVAWLEFRHGEKRWSERFVAEEVDEDTESATATMERVWDRLALAVSQSVVAHLGGGFVPRATAHR